MNMLSKNIRMKILENINYDKPAVNSYNYYKIYLKNKTETKTTTTNKQTKTYILLNYENVLRQSKRAPLQSECGRYGRSGEEKEMERRRKKY